MRPSLLEFEWFPAALVLASEGGPQRLKPRALFGAESARLEVVPFPVCTLLGSGVFRLGTLPASERKLATVLALTAVQGSFGPQRARASG
jgi:hypothetical protein